MTLKTLHDKYLTSVLTANLLTAIEEKILDIQRNSSELGLFRELMILKTIRCIQYVSEWIVCEPH